MTPVTESISELWLVVLNKLVVEIITNISEIWDTLLWFCCWTYKKACSLSFLWPKLGKGGTMYVNLQAPDLSHPDSSLTIP